MPTLRTVLKDIGKELRQNEKIREEAHNDMRKATSTSKQSILLIHQKRMKEARELVEKAKKIISKLNATSKEYPEIVYCGMFDAARQEYAEANIFLSSIEEERFVAPKEIDVPSIDYVLGLADVIGEYRRLTLDSLREGNLKKGERCLQIMDEIYIELMAMDEAYVLVPGLRRKCDVARKIIEITRGDITQETRRNSLEEYLKRFEKRARRKRQNP
jgi:translin